MPIVSEGKARIRVPSGSGTVARKMPVFYNPVMEFNRSLSISLLNNISRKHMKIALPLAATGVRGIRFIRELRKGKVSEVKFNDIHVKAFEYTMLNLQLNDISKDVVVSSMDANLFLLQNEGFDYIDIDPYGSPSPFLESAVKKLSRGGILAVTATDTAALCSAKPKACLRKYWSRPMWNEQMHEIGLRILARRVQLTGAMHDKALTPIYSYSKDHYLRIFFVCKKGKQLCDAIMKKHLYFLYCTRCMQRKTSRYNHEKCCGKQMEFAGLLWTGELWDAKLAKKIASDFGPKKERTFCSNIAKEAGIGTVGIYDLHKLSRLYQTRPPKPEKVVSALRKKKFRASRTHIDDNYIRTDASIGDLVETIKKIQGQK